MQIRTTVALIAISVAAGLATPTSAATIAAATTPLNIRSGPGPQYSVIGAIPDHAKTTIIGCIRNSLWCQVDYNGRQGWAYARYLTANFSGRSLILAENLNGIPTATYQPPSETVGTAITTPTISGTLVARPTTAQPLVITPPPTVHSYVVNHPVSPVYLDGEVVEGVGVPEGIALTRVPGYDYEYAYINRVPVLIEPKTRQVEYVYR